MLIRLQLGNIALVEAADMTFEPGLAVITGETGAGKSIVVNALALALGQRADREMIRSGADMAWVEATFTTSSLPSRFKKDFGDYLQGDTFTVRREISRDGNSKVKINGVVATLTRLRELTEPIAEIIGQHAGQMLMEEDNHLLFLDHFANVEPARDEVGEIYREWEQVHRRLSQVRAKRAEFEKEHELLIFQKQEIERAQIRVGEEDELNAERRRLDSARELMESANLVQNLLDNDDSVTSVLSILRESRHELDKMAKIDSSLLPQVSELTEIDFKLEEVRRFIEQYGSSIEDNPARLEEINQRLDEIFALKQKYGGSEQAILDSLVDIKEGLGDRPDVSSQIADLEKQQQALISRYSEKALALSDTRKKAAAYLSKLVIKELGELAIDNGGFEFEFIYEDHPDGILMGDRSVRPFESGLEQGRFVFSANPGEPLKSLVKTASGGEVSRVLLALKGAEKKNAQSLHPLLVFDEVDVGIGGRTAIEVARKLKKLSEDSQIIVITHLHQIARMADHHYVASKSRERGVRSTITVDTLDDKGREAELERMMALPVDIEIRRVER